jgi:hypothetical protein
VAACTTPDPQPPAAGTFEWRSYANRTVGFTLEYPDAYTADTASDGRSVFFRGEGGVPVKVYWTSAREADGHGLWFAESPISGVTLAGREGHLYDYSHCDGPFCSRMKSYVIPLRDRFLALEFRSEGPLHEVNRHILDSFRIERTASGGAPPAT